MNVLIQHPAFSVWLRDLRDHGVRVRILARLRSAEAGHFGDTKAVAAELAKCESTADLGTGFIMSGADR
jgi:putative component of toxin-antitoxin plasmid stabilization module